MKDKSKKSILFLIGSFGVGGKERQLTELINGLPKDHYSLHLLVKDTDAYYIDKIRQDLVSFRSFDREHFRIDDFIILARHINEIRPDCVCSWATVTSHFCLLARFFTSHSYRLLNCSIRTAPIHLAFSNKFERFMYSFYKIVVANSIAGLTSYRQKHKKGRYVLYNGFDATRVPTVSQKSAREKLNFQTNAFIVVMVASLTSMKDHNTFLYSIRECTEYQKQIDFFIVGEGPNRPRLEKKAQQMEISSNLYFLGKRDDVELIFRAADVSVLTSTAEYGEGISNSIIESLGCGTPVIATDSPGTREVIDDGINGLIIHPGDFKELAKKIILLKNHPEMIERLSRAGIKKIKSKFSLDKMVASFINIIESQF